MLFSNMQEVDELKIKLEEAEKIINDYHREVETLMRQLQRTGNNIIILSERLRAHGLDYKITPDEKTKLSTDNADIRT